METLSLLWFHRKMKMLLVFVSLCHVSQHDTRLEVDAGTKVVLLPCHVPVDFKSHVVFVEWSRSDLSPKIIHRCCKDRDCRHENKRFSSRTSMRKDALTHGNMSLTVEEPRISDTGTYTCKVRPRGKEEILKKVLLYVKVPRTPTLHMEAYVGMESFELICLFSSISEDTTVVWNRSDLSPPSIVHQHQKDGDELKDQNPLYRNRTSMHMNALHPGRLSLTIKGLTLSDSGTYTCSVREFSEERTVKEIKLQVKEPFPLWATVVICLVLIVFLVLIGAVLLRFLKSGPQVVEVESGEESVLLPCKTTANLPKDVRVEWMDSSVRKVHVYANGSDQPGEQHGYYTGRTEMKRNLLRTGDVGLRLKIPTYQDTGIFTCTVSSNKKNLMKKKLELWVTVSRVEVESDEESVLLSFRNTGTLPEDIRVEWTYSKFTKVHVYENGSDQPNKQDWFFKERTEMKRELQDPGDVSLTVKKPTDTITDTYTCTIYSKEGNILLRKQVELKVKVCEVEVEEGAESVLLPFRTTGTLPEDVTVDWGFSGPQKKIVHQYNSSDGLVKQDEIYRGRTAMKADMRLTNDISLTLKQPTVRDRGTYICVLTSSKFKRNKSVLLRVKGRMMQSTPNSEEDPLIQVV